MSRLETEQRIPRNFPPNPAEVTERIPPKPVQEVKDELQSHSIKSSQRRFDDVTSQAKSTDAKLSSAFPFGMKPHPRVLSTNKRKDSDAFHNTSKEPEAAKNIKYNLRHKQEDSTLSHKIKMKFIGKFKV